MKVPLGWLAEWVDLPDEAELCERLTLAGLEIEEILRSGPDLSAIRVGHVVERRQHPNADRLSLCRVDVGGPEPISVVCGAPNVAQGQKVAVALPGTTLPDGTKLKKSKIRGEASEGMICSARELGLSDEHAGILVLDPARQDRRGAARGDARGRDDPRRRDHAEPRRLGLHARHGARGAGAVRRRAARCRPASRSKARARRRRTCAIRDRSAPTAARATSAGSCAACGSARRRTGCARGSSRRACARSTTWSTRRTWCCTSSASRCTRSTSRTLRGAQVRVRRALEGEKLATLDGETRALAATDLVIADAERAIALAGVIGGAETEVREGTTDILIESAQFAPKSVRRSGRRLGLRTEASYRFERGVDRDGVARAADRCARLIAELSGGTVSKGRVEALGTPLPHVDEVAARPRASQPPARREPRARRGRRAARAGRRARAAGAGGQLRCAIPSWRNDLEIPADLCEEVARIHGYDRLEATMPRGRDRAGRRSPPATRCSSARARRWPRAGLVELRLLPVARPRGPRPAAAPARRPAARDRAPRERHAGAGLRAVEHAAARPAPRRAAQPGAPGRAAAHLRGRPRVPRPRAGASCRTSRCARSGLVTRQRPRRPVGRRRAAVAVLHGQGRRRGGCSPSSASPPRSPAAARRPGSIRAPAASCAAATRSCVALGELHPEVARAFELEAHTARSSSSTSRPASALAPELPRYREPSRLPGRPPRPGGAARPRPARGRGPRGDPADGRVSAGRCGHLRPLRGQGSARGQGQRRVPAGVSARGPYASGYRGGEDDRARRGHARSALRCRAALSAV